MQKLTALLLLFLATTFADAQNKVYPTGHKTPANIEQIVAAKWKQNGYKMLAAPKATAATYDCVALGLVPPIVDQGQCGSCWDFSGCSGVTSALIKAGYGKNDGTLRISEQFILDCTNNGGCNGDDNTTVLAIAKANGIPNTSDYGPYQARAGVCKTVNSLLLYKLADYGFCGSQSGVAATQAIKNAMVQYGPIPCAIAADDAFMNMKPGTVFKGNNRVINHDIVLVGWDDVKGAWKLRNSWGLDWVDGGYCWIAYGANQVGTEAVWCYATPLPAPPGPTPPVPQPVPPSPVPIPGATISGVTLGYSDGTSNALNVVPAGSITINSMMTLKDFADALEKASRSNPDRRPAAAPLCPQAERRIADLESTIRRLEAVINGTKGNPK